MDFDEFELVYRNNSLLFPSNGGKLVSAPKSAGWGRGGTHGWVALWSGAGLAQRSKTGRAARIRVFIRRARHDSHGPGPSKPGMARARRRISVSTDGQAYTRLGRFTLPDKGKPNANFALRGQARPSAPARFLKTTALSGYRSEHWGLGEIEAFGTGATMLPENEPNHVSLDATELKPGTAYHYRLVARNSRGTTAGTRSDPHNAGRYPSAGRDRDRDPDRISVGQARGTDQPAWAAHTVLVRVRPRRSLRQQDRRRHTGACRSRRAVPMPR